MKKFISAILLMAAMVLSVSTFVSCNDLKEDIEKVTTDTTALQQEVAGLKTALGTANDNVAKAQDAADDALDAAQDAQGDADAAAQAAEDLKNALANLASEKAIRDAIANALKNVEDAIKTLEGEDDKLYAEIEKINASLKSFVETKDLPDFSKFLTAEDIEGLATETALKELEGKITTLQNTIKNYNDLITEAEVNELLKDYVKKEDLASQLAELNKLLGENGEIATIKNKLTEIEEYLDTEYKLSLKSFAENVANTALKSIAYVPHTLDSKLNEFEGGFVSIVRPKSATAPTTWDFVMSNCVPFEYRINPAGAADTFMNKYELSFLDLTVNTRADESTPLLSVVDTPAGKEEVVGGEGAVIVWAKANKNLNNESAGGIVNNKANLVALRASLIENENIIVSDYVAVADTDLDDFVIKNKKVQAAGKEDTHFNVAWYNTTDKPYAADGAGFYEEADAIEGTPVELPFNGTINLNDYVYTSSAKLANLNLGTAVKDTLDNAYPCVPVSYKFTKVAEYKLGDSDTDQQKFIELDPKVNGKVTVKNWGTGDFTTQFVAVGKTPVVRVDALVGVDDPATADDERVAIKSAYIKIKIVKNGTKPVEYKGHDTKEFTYTKLPSKGFETANIHTGTTKADYTDAITWEEITTNVLAQQNIDLHHSLFTEVYDVNNIAHAAEYTYINGKAVTDPDEKVIPGNAIEYQVIDPTSTSTFTSCVGYSINSYIQENCSGKVTYTINPKAGTFAEYYPVITVVMTFDVEHVAAWPARDTDYTVLETAEVGDYKYNETEKLIQIVKGYDKKTNGEFAWSFETHLKEAFKPLATGATNACGNNHGALQYKLTNDIDDENKEDRATLTDEDSFVNATINLNVTKNSDEILNNYAFNDYEDAGTLVDEPADLVWKESTMDIPVTMYSVLDNGNKCEMTYYVRFVNPFSIEIKDIVLETIGEKVSAKVADYLVIKLNGELVWDGKNEYEMAGVPVTHDFSIVYNADVMTDNIMGVNEDTPDVNRLNWDREYINWNNGGTKLNFDKKLNVAVYGYNEHVGWFKVAENGGNDKVTLKASSNN